MIESKRELRNFKMTGKLAARRLIHPTSIPSGLTVLVMAWLTLARKTSLPSSCTGSFTICMTNRNFSPDMDLEITRGIWERRSRKAREGRAWLQSACVAESRLAFCRSLESGLCSSRLIFPNSGWQSGLSWLHILRHYVVVDFCVSLSSLVCFAHDWNLTSQKSRPGSFSLTLLRGNSSRKYMYVCVRRLRFANSASISWEQKNVLK